MPPKSPISSVSETKETPIPENLLSASEAAGIDINILGTLIHLYNYGMLRIQDFIDIEKTQIRPRLKMEAKTTVNIKIIHPLEQFCAKNKEMEPLFINAIETHLLEPLKEAEKQKKPLPFFKYPNGYQPPEQVDDIDIYGINSAILLESNLYNNNKTSSWLAKVSPNPQKHGR